MIRISENTAKVLKGLLGQMSDGIWENSRAMERIWKNTNIIKENDLYFLNVTNNAYYILGKYTPMEFLNYLVNKIKYVVKLENEYDESGINLKRPNGTLVTFLHDLPDYVVKSACDELKELTVYKF